MKKNLFLTIVAVLSMLPMTGCIGYQGGDTHATNAPTLGQQLLDLQKAKDAGAITDPQYQAKRDELLQKK